MKQTPILYNTEMVWAIDAGRKTQTRRTKGLETFNKNPDEWIFNNILSDESAAHAFFKSKSNGDDLFSAKFPYGRVGDILWVRETFGLHYSSPETSFPVYRAQQDECGQFPSLDLPFRLVSFYEKWIPSIHMPKKVARTWLEITGIWVERIQDITDDDAVAEGIQIMDSWPELPDQPIYKMYGDETYMGDPTCFDPIRSFYTLWCATYGPSAVKNNPFVWVIEFKKVKDPNKLEQRETDLIVIDDVEKPIPMDKLFEGKIQIDFEPFGMP